MATTNEKLGTSTALTITLNSLANNAARQSNVLDNTSTLALDYFIGGGFKTASGALGTNPYVAIWASGLTDGTNYGGTNGSNVLGGGDAAFTMPTLTGNLILLAQVPINTNAAVEYMEPRSLAAVYGIYLPPKFVIVVQNVTGLGLDSSAGGTIFYTAVTTTTV